MLSLVGTGCDSGLNLSATILQAELRWVKSPAKGFKNVEFPAKGLDSRRGGPAGVRGRVHGIFCQSAKFSLGNYAGWSKHLYGGAGIDRAVAGDC